MTVREHEPVAAAPDGLMPSALARHEPTHDRLLMRPPVTGVPARREGVDLVVIPTSRSFAATADVLVQSVELARTLAAPLLLLCSREARPAEFPVDRVDAADAAIAIADLSFSGWSDLLPELRTTGHRLAAIPVPYRRDTADKRNLGLIFALAQGLERVLFWDDDVSSAPGVTLDADAVGSAVSVLGHDGVRGGGWALRKVDNTSTDDNSVVCHARRLVGLEQGCFLGGGAFAVQVNGSTPFFPRIYNEDWLFQYKLLRPEEGTPGRLAAFGQVRQQQYNPFTRRRAQVEEVGDILGEGLYQVLGKGPRAEAEIYRKQYWVEVIRSRGEMIKDIQRRLEPRLDLRLARSMTRPLPTSVRARLRPLLDAPTPRSVHLLGNASAALDESLSVHVAVDGDPEQLAGMIPDYLREWRLDLRRWQKAMARPATERCRALLDDPHATRLVGTAARKAFGLGPH